MLRIIYVKIWICYTGSDKPSDNGEYFDEHFIAAAVVVFIFIFILLLKNVFSIYCKFFFQKLSLLTYLFYLLTVACYINRDIFFSTNNIFSKKRELIFGALLLLKTKAISVGIVYGRPKDTNIL